MGEPSERSMERARLLMEEWQLGTWNECFDAIAAALDEARQEGRREGAEQENAACYRIVRSYGLEMELDAITSADWVRLHGDVSLADAIRARSNPSECICPTGISDCPEELSGRPCLRRKSAEDMS